MTSRAPSVHPLLEIDAPIDGLRIVRHAGTGKYFRLGAAEAAFLESLDGARTRAELSDGAAGFSNDQVEQLLAWFERNRLLDDPTPVHVPRRSWISQLPSWIVHSDRHRIRLLNPDRFLDARLPLVKALVSRPALLVYLIAFLLPVAVYLGWPEQVRRNVAVYTPVHDVIDSVFLYLLFLAMIACHEFAHAVACKAFGARVEKIGLMFFFFNPIVYCDVSDSWRLPTARQRALIASAGIFFQCVLGSIALTAWMVSGAPLLATFAMLSFGFALFNLFPFVKMDGYWILVHTLNEPNLRTKALAALDDRLRIALGRKVAAHSAPSTGVFLFGIAFAAAIPLFWLLGLLGVYQLGSRFSPALGWILSAALGLVLAYRASLAAIAYFKTLDDPSPLARL